VERAGGDGLPRSGLVDRQRAVVIDVGAVAELAGGVIAPATHVRAVGGDGARELVADGERLERSRRRTSVGCVRGSVETAVVADVGARHRFGRGMTAISDAAQRSRRAFLVAHVTRHGSTVGR
jgi:hypothetical protein